MGHVEESLVSSSWENEKNVREKRGSAANNQIKKQDAPGKKMLSWHMYARKQENY